MTMSIGSRQTLTLLVRETCDSRLLLLIMDMIIVANGTSSIFSEINHVIIR